MTNLMIPRGEWVIVAGSFHCSGGMDKANYALAQFLVESGATVHLVSHHVERELASHPAVTVHLAARPLNSWFLGGWFLDFKARSVVRQLKKTSDQVICVVNGGNCLIGDVNWSHYVHRGWSTLNAKAPIAYRLRQMIESAIGRRREVIAYRRAKLILTNSNITKTHVYGCLNGHSPIIRTVYLGGEADWKHADEQERAAARAALNIGHKRPLALFLGGLALDDRKGFDILFESWRRLCADPEWDVDLMVAGTGPAFSMWKDRINAAGLSHRVNMLGFRKDVPTLLAASDLLVSPVRYEPYGLNVQEALCSGLSVLVSANAGIAERFPMHLRPLVIHDTENVAAWMAGLKAWRGQKEVWRRLCSEFGSELRQRSWNDMATEMVQLIEATCAG